MQDGTYWVKQFLDKKISPEEYYRELDKKIQKTNPEINALVEWDLNQLLMDTAELKLDDKLPFSGLPVPLKMLGQEKEGWKSTMGSRLFLENRANRTSNFTKKMMTSGLIPAGQTNAPEFGFKNITDPEIYGPSRNPWNLDHSPGGSSGGAAAAVASGLFPIAGASDGGGSVRIPASFSGLIGLKPTRGAMPTGPSGYRGWQGAAIDFALTISMRDTEKLFYAMRGNAKAAPYHPPKDEWETPVLDRPLKIVFLTESPIGSTVSEDAIQATRNMAQRLTELGHEVTEIAYPVNGIALIESYYLMNGAETAAMFNSMEGTLQRTLGIEDMELMTWGLYQYGKKANVINYIQALNSWDKAAEKLEEIFENYDLFLTPTTAYPAPRIDQELQSDTIRNSLRRSDELSEKELSILIYEMFEASLKLSPFTQLANLTGQPAISLPTHVTSDGLPLGVQFMASKGREDLLFKIGNQLEQQLLFKLPKAYR